MKLVSKLLLVMSLLCLGTLTQASDHDDGELDLKGRALNLTDLYAFREDNQSGNAAHKPNLVLIMNTNPRSLPHQQYFFSTQALYQFHLTRVAPGQKAVKPTGKDDIVMGFQFTAPDTNNRQALSISLIKDGKTVTIDKSNSGGSIWTTNITDSGNDNLTNTTVTINGQDLTVFAGLREDPFFFDVEQFFKVRAAAISTGKFIGFLPAAQAVDFTHNYNVNAIVVRVPIALLQTAANETVFDVWETISVIK